MRDADVYPVSFFGQTFDLTRKILKDLHALETAQIEMLRKQVAEHQAPDPVYSPIGRHSGTNSTGSFDHSPGSDSEPNRSAVEPRVRKSDSELPAEEKIVQETIPLKEIEVPHKTILADKSSISLNDILEKKNLSDFRKAFSLNDRFRFRRELFGGNEEKMNKAIADLNDLSSYEESVTYLNKVLNWNIEDASVADFIKLLEKRFS